MPWLIHFTYLSHWITNSYTSICNFALPITTFFLNTQTHTHTQTHSHYHCSTVLWAAGQYVVVVRAPVDIKDRSGVADHHRVVLVHSTCLQHAAAATHSSDTEKSVKNSCEHWIAGQKTFRNVGLNRAISESLFRHLNIFIISMTISMWSSPYGPFWSFYQLWIVPSQTLLSRSNFLCCYKIVLFYYFFIFAGFLTNNGP